MRQTRKYDTGMGHTFPRRWSRSGKKWIITFQAFAGKLLDSGKWINLPPCLRGVIEDNITFNLFIRPSISLIFTSLSWPILKL